jgi:hypothetical protein
MRNQGLAVKVKQVEVVAKVRVRELEQAVKAQVPAAGPKRYTMATHSIPNRLRDRAQADPSGALLKGENPSIGAQKSPETQAKASDLVEDLAYSAIILVVDTK